MYITQRFFAVLSAVIIFSGSCQGSLDEEITVSNLDRKQILIEEALVDSLAELYRDCPLSSSQKLAKFGLVCFVRLAQGGKYIPIKFQFNLRSLDVENLGLHLNFKGAHINKNPDIINMSSLLYDAVVEARIPYLTSFFARNAPYDVERSDKARKQKEYLDSLLDAFVDNSQ